MTPEPTAALTAAALTAAAVAAATGPSAGRLTGCGGLFFFGDFFPLVFIVHPAIQLELHIVKLAKVDSWVRGKSVGHY
jgi:hypothetical protein